MIKIPQSPTVTASRWLRVTVLGLSAAVMSTLGPMSLGLFGAGVPTSARAAIRDIYPDPVQAKPDLAAALRSAGATHRRVILDFGGNWCPDCHVLDTYFHDETNKPLLEANYLLVHVNIGQRDQNLDIAARYAVPLAKGVPALAVLDSDGKLLYSQKTGEFEAMRGMKSSAVTAFLDQWKPAHGGH